MSDEIRAIHKLNGSATYKWNDKFTKMLNEFRSIEICDEAMVWNEAQAVADPNATWGKVVTNYVNDSSISESWALGSLYIFGSMFDARLKSKFVEKIKDPVQARLLIRNLGNILSRVDIKYLQSVYAGRLPYYDAGLDK